MVWRVSSLHVRAALLGVAIWACTHVLSTLLGGRAFLAPGPLRGGPGSAASRRVPAQRHSVPSEAIAADALAAGSALGLLLAAGVGAGRVAARRHGRGDVSQQAVKLTYFKLWAKGPSIALALQHSGMDWEGAFPEDWKSLKPTTPFFELPILEVPEIGSIGHELAILNYIGQSSPKMGGADVKEFAVSQQLLNQAEDIYQKLTKLKAGLITGDDAQAVWTDENDQTHNRNFGVRVFLKLLEAFYAKCGVQGGKFTSSGTTVGECKLFATLHTLKLIDDGVLADFPGLSAFYERFASEPATQAILQGTGGMPGQFDQYFKF